MWVAEGKKFARTPLRKTKPNTLLRGKKCLNKKCRLIGNVISLPCRKERGRMECGRETLYDSYTVSFVTG